MTVSPQHGLETKKAGRSELVLRVLSALVLAPLAIAIAVYGGGVFALFWTIAAILVAREWFVLIGFESKQLTLVWVIAALGISAGAFVAENPAGVENPASVVWPLLIGPVLAGCIAALFRSPKGSRAWSFAGVLYASIIAIIPIEILNDPAQGLVPILWVFAVVWLTDICAYFVGRSLGGPKLWPTISPKKTWSGFIGGLIGGVLAALGVVALSANAFGLAWAWGPRLVLITILASLMGQAGDLFESSLKRRFGVKDTGHLIPGHGGVMDRLDSFVFVCVLLLIATKSGFLGPSQ